MLPKKRVSLLPSPEAMTSTATLTGPTITTSSTDLAHTTSAPGGKRAEEDDGEDEEEYTK